MEMSLKEQEKIENDLIGLSEAEVVDYMDKSNLPYRTVREDDKNFMCTCDFRIERANISYDNHRVSDVSWG